MSSVATRESWPVCSMSSTWSSPTGRRMSRIWFIPERFDAEQRRRLPAGAYIPVGGGQRICIGKRFGQLVVKAVAATLLREFTCSPTPGFELHVAKLPTLSPENGLPMLLATRQASRSSDTVPI